MGKISKYMIVLLAIIMILSCKETVSVSTTSVQSDSTIVGRLVKSSTSVVQESANIAAEGQTLLKELETIKETFYNLPDSTGKQVVRGERTTVRSRVLGTIEHSITDINNVSVADSTYDERINTTTYTLSKNDSTVKSKPAIGFSDKLIMILALIIAIILFIKLR